MFSLALVVQLTILYGLLARAQLSPQPVRIPLAVKTPYLHGWLSSGGGKSTTAQWPNFIAGLRTLGWIGMIRVDNQAYQWLGDASGNFTRTVTSELTPSRSIFRMEAGPIQFNVTFLSPIEPNDYVRQSMPFSYMYINGISANDSLPHSIQVYSDISAEWASRDDTTLVKWSTTNNSEPVYHAIQQQIPFSMMEKGGISEDATVYYTMAKRPGLTWRTGNDNVTRTLFVTNGTLSNTMDRNFRAISPNWPVFALSVDLGIISPGNQPDPVVWAIGLVRDPLVRYTTGGVALNRRAYYWSNYTSIDEVISAFLSDFPDALSRSVVLDNKVLSAGSAISLEYAGILALVTRQIFASMDITIPSAQPGPSNSSDVKIFMKDIGQSQRTNPVEVIYGALPALLFFNSSLARDLLQSMLAFQSSSQYPNPYAAPNLGTSYPLVYDNSTDTHTLAVENCGNMLIMAYAQAAKSGDGALLSRYYSVLQRWADFLIENSLHPSGFITADGLDNPDMSNLAVKGILGVYSMAKISEAVGMSNTTYMDQATRLIKDWKQLAIGADGHIQAVYGQASSWGLMYNLFPAVWLKTGLIEDTVLEHQAQFYGQQNSSDFGLNLDTSRFDTAYPHWTLMTAATIPDNFKTIRNGLIKSIYHRVCTPSFELPLPVAYQPSTGGALPPGVGDGSPILGAAFAAAALQLQNIAISAPQIGVPSSSPTGSPTGSPTKDNVGAITGGVLGSLASLLLVVTAIFILWRKHKQRTHQTNLPTVTEYYDIDGGRPSPSRPPSPSAVRNLPISPPAQGAVAPPMSRKQREALNLPDRRISVQSEMPLLAPSSTASGSVSGAEDLRVELEHLRRAVEFIRRTTDAPPEYN